MKYRHNDYSYSAWGENSYGNATGSSWLTAFVVKSMAQSAPYITIDMGDVKKSVEFLIDTQREDGCFPKVGKVFSSYMKGGLADGDNIAGSTAFTLIALLEANVDHINKEVYINSTYCITLKTKTTPQKKHFPLTLSSIITPLTPLKYHVFENIMENGAFAPKEQMLHFPLHFQKYSKQFFFEYFQCCLRMKNDVMI